MSDFKVTWSGNGFDKMSQAIRKVPKEAFNALREATFSTERLIKKEYMNIKDGEFLGTSNGVRRYSKRTAKPGVRTVTGNLKRNVRSKFQQSAGNLRGAVGTNVSYGVELEKDTRYEYLKPGLKDNLEKIQKIFSDFIKKALS